jgi:hypothetical protein
MLGQVNRYLQLYCRHDSAASSSVREAANMH